MFKWIVILISALPSFLAVFCISDYGPHYYSSIRSEIIGINREENASNELELVRYYLAKGANPNEFSVSKGLLHIAAFRNKSAIIEELVKQGADVDLQECREGLTPLMIAVKYNNVDAVIALLKNNSNLSIKSIDGKTVFDLKKTEEIKKLLTENNETSK